MNSIALRYALLAGILSGLVYAGFSFGTYYTSISSFFSFTLIYKLLPLVTIAIIVLGFSLRKKLGGYISFKEVLQFAMVAYLSYEIVVALTSYILFIQIDPMLTEKMKKEGIKLGTSWMKNSGQSQTEIDQTFSKVDKQKENTGAKNIILGLGMFLVLDFVLSLLISIAIKKDRPADLDYTPQSIA